MYAGYSTCAFEAAHPRTMLHRDRVQRSRAECQNQFNHFESNISKTSSICTCRSMKKTEPVSKETSIYTCRSIKQTEQKSNTIRFQNAMNFWKKPLGRGIDQVGCAKPPRKTLRCPSIPSGGRRRSKSLDGHRDCAGLTLVVGVPEQSPNGVACGLILLRPGPELGLERRPIIIDKLFAVGSESSDGSVG